jgi:Uma2 family endonuclease
MTSSVVRQPINPPPQEQRLMLRSISWQQFKNLQAALDTVAGVRLSYFHGILEVMTLSPEHEDLKSLIGTLVEIYLLELGIRYYRRGSPTLS